MHEGSPKEEKELFTLDELIQSFSVDRISKSGAIFDNDILKWMNSQYLKEKTLDELVDLCLPFLQKAYDLSDKSDEPRGICLAP